MKSVVEQMDDEMKKMSVTFQPKVELEDAEYLFVEVDIDCEYNLEKVQELMLTRKVHRGTIYHVLFEQNNKGFLTLKVGTKVPRDFAELYFESFQLQMKNSIRATAFPDLTWLHSEGTTNQDLEQVFTQLRENVKLGDLTNVLPSKFVDDFVEMMHVLNQSVLSGILSDAIIYGPFILEKSLMLEPIKYQEDGQLIIKT